MVGRTSSRGITALAVAPLLGSGGVLALASCAHEPTKPLQSVEQPPPPAPSTEIAPT